MSMSEDEFLNALRHTPRNWYLEDGTIRRMGPKGQECPVSSILKRPIHAYKRVGEFLGLSSQLIEDVADAADGNDFCPQLRAKVLDACGLPQDDETPKPQKPAWKETGLVEV